MNATTNSSMMMSTTTHHIKKIDTNMIIVIVCLVIAFLIIGLISMCICECADIALRDLLSAASNRRSSRAASARGLSKSIRETFPIFVYSDVKELKLGKAHLECAICLNEFDENEALRLLPDCSHVFHRDCIDTWLVSYITCPVCRACLIPVLGDYSPSTPVDSVYINTLYPQEITTTATDMQVVVDSCHDSMGIGEESEKYTLRLPKEVLDKLLKSESGRSGSCISFRRERSLVQGYRSKSFRPFEYERFDYDRKVKSERWMLSVTPTTCFPAGTEMAEGTRKSFGFVKSPLDRLFGMNRDGCEHEQLEAQSPV